MKKIFLLASLIFMLSLPLLAQAAEEYFPFELNDGIVAAIQTAFGIGLLGLVQLVKNGLKKIWPKYADLTPMARHAIMYALTLLITSGVTFFVLTQAHMLTTARFVLYDVYAWGLCNGFWKSLKELISKIK